MTTEKPNIIYAKQIAELHKQGIPTGFISSLNTKVVKRLYETIIKNEICFVLKEDEKVVGFVSCAIDTGKLYKKFIKANFFSVLPFFVLKVFNISFLQKIFETLKAPKKVKDNKPNLEIPELLSIVIDTNQQAKGLGKKLLDALENELTKRKINKYKVVAGEILISANKFYLKYDFKLSHKIELHKGSISNVFTKTLT